MSRLQAVEALRWTDRVDRRGTLRIVAPRARGCPDFAAPTHDRLGVDETRFVSRMTGTRTFLRGTWLGSSAEQHRATRQHERDALQLTIIPLSPHPGASVPVPTAIVLSWSNACWRTVRVAHHTPKGLAPVNVTPVEVTESR